MLISRSAAVLGRINPTPDLTPGSFTQTRRRNVHRLGAGKNARAPARAGKGNGARSAAVAGRIIPTTDPTPASFTQTRRPNFDGRGAAKNARAPANSLEERPTVGSAAVPGRINPTPDLATRLNHANPTATWDSPQTGGRSSHQSANGAASYQRGA